MRVPAFFLESFEKMGGRGSGRKARAVLGAKEKEGEARDSDNLGRGRGRERSQEGVHGAEGVAGVDETKGVEGGAEAAPPRRIMALNGPSGGRVCLGKSKPCPQVKRKASGPDEPERTSDTKESEAESESESEEEFRVGLYDIVVIGGDVVHLGCAGGCVRQQRAASSGNQHAATTAASNRRPQQASKQAATAKVKLEGGQV